MADKTTKIKMTGADALTTLGIVQRPNAGRSDDRSPEKAIYTAFPEFELVGGVTPEILNASREVGFTDAQLKTASYMITISASRHVTSGKKSESETATYKKIIKMFPDAADSLKANAAAILEVAG